MRISEFCSLLPDHFAIYLIDIIDPKVSLFDASKFIEKPYKPAWAFKNRWSSQVNDLENIEGLIFESKVFFTVFQILSV